MPSPHRAHAQKRRSTRIDQTILLTVRGMDAFRAPYVEKVPTLVVSCHGCRYRSKHEVIQGDIVLLEVKPSQGHPELSTRARVKWLQRLTSGKEQSWDVGVELETPGNFWDVAAPPADWLPVPESDKSNKMIGGANSGRELRNVPQSEQQIRPMPNRVAAQLSVLDPPPASLAPFLVGLNEHVQRLVSEAATAVFVKEKDSLIEEFRAQLQDETTRTLDRVIARYKQELVNRALKELNKVLEASARSTHEHWVKKIEEDLNNATIRMTAQSTQVSERVENMAITATEHLQLKMAVLRRETIDEFKIGSLGICQQTQDFLQQSAAQFVNQMEQRISELTNQFESNVNERATEISKERLNELQDCTRRYLESINQSIAEVSKKTALHPHD